MDRIELRPPPVITHSEPGAALMGALPVLGGLGSIGLVASMAGGPRRYVGIGLFVAVAILLAAAQLGHQWRQRTRTRDTARRDYLRHLADVRRKLWSAGEVRRADAVACHPPPRALPALAECGAWQPTRGLTVRYGTADRPVELGLIAPDIPPGADPVCTEALRRLVAAHERLPRLPVTVDLGETRTFTAPSGTVRAVVCSAAASPQVTVAVLASPDRHPRWEWVKWLPSASGAVTDGVGPRRLVAASAEELLPLLPDGRHLLLVVDGVTADQLDVPGTILLVADRTTADGQPLAGAPDDCAVEVAEAFARRCGRLTVPTSIMTAPDWAPRPTAERLRVPLGHSDAGVEVLLDLKESALGGSGPHGMVIGATGSGKSELLRWLVLHLALTHPPAQLNLVLIDFKGGTAFDGLARLPHVAALITNLADELDLLDRMTDALMSELTRRQELVRAADGDRGGLPTLLIVVDEFAELLVTRPELDELFATLGRLGRGLGIHLLLASQRFDDGRWRGLESHLSYRIALRTFTGEESRSVIGVVDAYELPPLPGIGFVRTDPRTLVRFRAPYVAAPVHTAAGPQRVLPFTAGAVKGPVAETTTYVETAVAAMIARQDGRAHRIWLPPLEHAPTLADLLTCLAADPLRGFGQRSSTVPLGVVDRPRQQRRDPLDVDLTTGHVAVAGVAGSGRSTLLRTAVAGLALTRTPEEVTIHLLDVGGALAPLAGLPHVAAIAGRDQPDLAARLVRDLTRNRDRPAVLVVDGWAELRHLWPEIEDQVTSLVGQGRSDVHLLAAMTQWSDARASLRSALTTRIELRLGDPLDSEVDRRMAASVPRARPGRGLADAAHFLAALPRLDEAGDADTALGVLVEAVDRHWHGPRPQRLRALPALVRLHDLPSDDGLRLGVREGTLATRTVPPSGHLMVLGDGGSGRTAVLRTLVREIDRTQPTDQVVYVDPRGALSEEVSAGHRVVHLRGDPAAGVAELARSLTLRLDSTARAQPDDARTWLVVDDLDLLAPTLWQPLLPLLARAEDVRLRAVVARRAGGAARAFYEPLLGSLRELRAPAILLAGSPDEGPVMGGVRMAPATPGRARWVDSDGREDPFQVAWTDR